MPRTRYGFFSLLFLLSALAVGGGSWLLAGGHTDCTELEDACEPSQDYFDFYFYFPCYDLEFSCCFCADDAGEAAALFMECLESNGISFDYVDMGSEHEVTILEDGCDWSVDIYWPCAPACDIDFDYDGDNAFWWLDP